nr:MAG TPA: hypothetical protein [Caudoviricetes sp.]
MCDKTSFHTCKRATFSSVALPFTRRPSAVKTCDHRAITVRLHAVLLAGNWRDVRDSDNRGNAEREKEERRA